MSDEQRIVLPLKAAYAFAAAHGLEAESERVRTMEIEWESSYTSTVRRGYIIALFSKHGIFEEFKDKLWNFGNTPAGMTKTRFFLRIKDRYDEFLRTGEEEAEIEQGEEAEEQSFAAESDLRDFLAKNPACIERNLRLYSSTEQTGVEFPIDDGKGRIDLLAIDGEGQFVVIELKLGRGRERTLGQLLYYMGWVDRHLAKTPCRGIIISKEIPEELVLAVQRVPGVSLCRYNLSVSAEPVKLSSRT